MSWYDLTERQQELDRAIDRSKVKLDSSKWCLCKVMFLIGAKSSEKEYVQSRINLRLRTTKVLDKTDEFIDRTERMLDKFMKK